MGLSPEQQDDLTEGLTLLAYGIAAALGHDPDDPEVGQKIIGEFRKAYEWIVLRQTERDVAR